MYLCATHPKRLDMNDELIEVSSPETVKKSVAADLKNQGINYTKLGEILGIKRASAANLMADKTKYYNKTQALLLFDSFGYALSFLEKGQGTLYKEIDPLKRRRGSYDLYKKWVAEEAPTVLDTLGSVIRFFLYDNKNSVDNIKSILEDAYSLYSLYNSTATIIRANLKVDSPHDISQTIEAFQRLAQPIIDSILQEIEKGK